jgi:putative FmdB family regulatory protein
MPTYEYRCRECGHELEAVQSFDDAPLAECPSCGGSLRKKFGAPGIAFKGSGFYKTDSRSSNGSSKGAASPAKAGSTETSTSSPDSGSGSGSGPSTKAPAAAGSSGSGGSSGSQSTPSG